MSIANKYRWTRRLTVIANETRPDDWCVLRDGVELGRVHRAPAITGTLPFIWSSWTEPSEIGRAETLEDALEQCRAAIGDLPVPPYKKRGR